MGSYRLELALLCLIGLAFFHVSQAQNSPEDYLKAHNDDRAEVGVGSMTWDDTVAAYASIYADESARDCNLVHSGGTYGENIAWGSGNMSAAEAVQLWASEKPYYDYNNNSCIRDSVCQHYTQLVWAKSVRLGCARAQCNSTDHTGGTFIICNYDPPGNNVGQRPFVKREGSQTKAQNSPEEYLAAHNVARAEVGVGPMTWDDTVAAYARIYANERARDCKPVHSGGTYGENIAWSSGNMSATEAVQLWASEKPYYDYNSNSCIGGQQCQHYTQLVWHNSVGLGCARVQCNAGGTFITCNYDPPGNYVGQRPFLIREASACFHVKLYM